MNDMNDSMDQAPDAAPLKPDAASSRLAARAAQELVATRRQRIEQLLDEPCALGVGPDITDQQIMRAARR